MERRQWLRRDLFLKIVALVILIAILWWPLSQAIPGDWKGQVVDRESRKPIEGAVVLMVWYKHYSLMDQTREYYDSEEYVTGADGRFFIKSRWTWNIFVQMDRPEIYIFKSGYGRWQFRDVEKYSQDEFVRQKEAKAEWQQLTGEGAMLELPRLKTREERVRFQGSLPPSRVPDARMSKFLEEYNAERRALDLPPVHVLPKEGK